MPGAHPHRNSRRSTKEPQRGPARRNEVDVESGRTPTTSGRTPISTAEMSTRESTKSEHQRRMKFASGRPVSGRAAQAADDFVRGILRLGVSGLREEFAELQREEPKMDVGCEAFLANPIRNRFKNLPCMDSTRVILKLDVPPETDYIHASWVEMADVGKVYIATQAPMPDTTEDFWRMCYQESVKTILVLCNFVEDDKTIFEKYWPESDEVLEYGPFSIDVKKEAHGERISTFYMELTCEGAAEKPQGITLVHVTDWAGRSFVECGVTILRVIKRIRRAGTCVVQCANGVGRTAVVIGVDSITTRLFKGQTVTLKEVTEELRSMRACSIQTANQYILLASAVLSYIKAKVPFKYQNQVATFREEIMTAAMG